MDNRNHAERPVPVGAMARRTTLIPWLALLLAAGFLAAGILTLSKPEAMLPAGLAGQHTVPLALTLLAALLLVLVAVHAARHSRREQARLLLTLTEQNAALTLELSRQRQQAEQAAAVARKYRDIYDTAMEGMFTLDIQGRFLSANPALLTLLAYDSEAQLQAEIQDVSRQLYVDQENRDTITQALLGQEEVGSVPVEIRRRDGRTLWVAISARIIRNNDGRAIAFQGSVRDITQWRQDRAALEKAVAAAEMANRAKSEFLTNMSHELRTPLNAIIGFSEIIATEAMGPLTNRAYREYAHDIHDSGQTLLALINDILDLSKIQAGRKELAERLIDIPRLIRSSLRLVAERADKGEVLLETAIDTDLPPVRGDEVALKQILSNLLSNAVKFTPPGGRVTCGARVEADGAMSIFVQDTGIGMSEKDMATAMEPFRQIEGSHSRSAGGVGLGLPLVKALADLHGGTARLESTIDVGTLVTITLPPDRVQSVPLILLRAATLG